MAQGLGASRDYRLPIVYQFPAAKIDTVSTLGRIVGPEGKRGRLIGISSVLTVATTSGATEIRLGLSSDPDKYGIQSIAVGAIGTVTTDITDYTASVLIPADTEIELSSDNGAVVGDADIFVYINWF